MEETKRRGRPSKRVSTDYAEEVEIIEDSNSDIDNEIFDDNGTFGNYNPLNDNIIERDYATPQQIDSLTDDIPEPSINNDLSFDELMASANPTEPQEEEAKRDLFDNPNPALNDLPPQDKQIACEQMVDTALDVYAGLHPFAGNFAKFGEDKINALFLNDEIDSEMQIPTESGENVSVRELFATYNQQVDEVFTYDREFGMKVRPAMVRIFMKKGWGMTDEQYVMFMFGKDIVAKISALYTFKKSMNATIDLLKEIHAENKMGIPTEKPQPQPQPQPQYKETENIQKVEVIEEEEEYFETEKLDVHEFKRPEFTKHPNIVQQEMDKANREAKNGAN